MDNNHVAGPGDENTIAETAGRLMRRFTEVPGLSLTTQQACRLAGVSAREQGVLDRITYALERKRIVSGRR